MKKLLLLLSLCLLVGCAAPSAPPATQSPSSEPAPGPSTQPALQEVVQHGDIKAMWLSQFDMADVYTLDGKQRPREDFTEKAAVILDNVADAGFNTVFLQIRPYADSMYPSEYYPMSACVVGQLGGRAEYDPVAILVALAHARGLSIHAWINPLRGMSADEITRVGQGYALGRWYADPQLRGRYLVEVQGRWYLNPAYEEVRALIQGGAAEALTLYDFDGLHMDDYFYPTGEEAFDEAAYREYRTRGGEATLADFRRDAVSELVQGLYRLTALSGEGRLFGISPAGNVDTVYNSQYADVYRWCSQQGYVDYICPQVYFGLEHGSHDFVKVCRTWQGLITLDSVELLVGMTFGKAFSREDPWAGSGKLEWQEHQDVLARSLLTTRELPACRGVAVFCYQYFHDPVTGEPVEETRVERENFIPLLRQVTWKNP